MPRTSPVKNPAKKRTTVPTLQRVVVGGPKVKLVPVVKQPRPATARREKKPTHCSCGGKMEYIAAFGLVFSWCETCTPVQTVNSQQLRKALVEVK